MSDLSPNADILSNGVCDICQESRGTIFVYYDVVKKRKIVAGQDWIICRRCLHDKTKEIKLTKCWLTTRIIK